MTYKQISLFPDMDIKKEELDVFSILRLRRAIERKRARGELRFGDPGVSALYEVERKYLKYFKSPEAFRKLIDYLMEERDELLGEVEEAIAKDDAEYDSPHERTLIISGLDRDIKDTEYLLALSQGLGVIESVLEL